MLFRAIVLKILLSSWFIIKADNTPTKHTVIIFLLALGSNSIKGILYFIW